MNFGTKNQNQNQYNQGQGLINDPFSNQIGGGYPQIGAANGAGKKNPFASDSEMIQPKSNNLQNVDGFMQNGNSGMAQSIMIDDIPETQFSLDDSPLGQASKFKCGCGKFLSKPVEFQAHSYECKFMQHDGYSSYVQTLSGLMQESNQLKINNMKVIFNAYVTQAGGANPKQQQKIGGMGQKKAQFQKEEEKDDADMQIDSGNKFMGYQQQQVNVDDIDQFMSKDERERAQTYYKNMQIENEEKLCKYCDKQITEQDQQKQKMTMLQSTECWHQCHIDCLREETIYRQSQNEDVKCGRCQAKIQDFELNEYLSEAEKAEINNQQQLQIVKLNPNFVSCQCSNIMELIPGDVPKGMKDDRGNAISKEAAQHLANHRIRCHKCEKNFCSKCNNEPYHLGKLCGQADAKSCRFCQEELKQPSPSMKPAFRDVCRKGECFNTMQKSCDKMLGCGHTCLGSLGEKQCMPCLEDECIAKMDGKMKPNVNKDEYCSICYCAALGQEPCVQLGCRHIFHVECLKKQVLNGYNGPRIVFNYIDCPDCKQRMSAKQCPSLDKEIQKGIEIEKVIIKKAMERAKFEDLNKEPRLKKVGDPYYNDLQKFAMSTLSYYECFKCKQPYYGGRKACDQAGNDYANFKKEELVCGKCAAVAVGGGEKTCKTHGTDFIEYKCKFCCNISQWFCWGNTHFCESCHKRQCAGDYVSRKSKDQLPKCEGPKKCPLKVKHPPNGEEHGLGCSICRNLQENAKDF